MSTMIHPPLLSSLSGISESWTSGLDTGSWLDQAAFSNYHSIPQFFAKLEAMMLKHKPLRPAAFLRRLADRLSQAETPKRRKGTTDSKELPRGGFRLPKIPRIPRSNEIPGQEKPSYPHLSSPPNEKGVPMSVGCYVRSGFENFGLKRSTSMPSAMSKLKSFDDLPYATDDLDFSSGSRSEDRKREKRISPGKVQRKLNHPRERRTSSAKLDSGHHVPSVGRIMKPLLLREATMNFRLKSYVGCDIGGTLCKITFFEPFDCQRQDIRKRNKFLKSSKTYGLSGKRDTKLEIERFGGRFHFLNFQTNHLEGAIAIIKAHSVHHEFANTSVPVTGGGAYKYDTYLQNHLKMGVHKVDELTCLLTGLNFTLAHVPDECFFLEHKKNGQLPSRRSHNMAGVYPYLLVNIGSGVSILRVESDKEFKRVGGSCIGGGTYWGLCKLLLGTETFKEAMMFGTEGNHHNVDMLVGDIYGGDYSRFNLKAETVASAFGKLVMQDKLKVSKADAAASLLHMIGANIAQLAYWCAREHKIDRILFAGNFLRMNMTSAIFLSSSINYWSQGKMKALFLRHEGYFGSLGALLMSKVTSMGCRETTSKSAESDDTSCPPVHEFESETVTASSHDPSSNSPQAGP